jgi:hypothetical protein
MSDWPAATPMVILAACLASPPWPRVAAPEVVARMDLGFMARGIEVVGRLAVVSGYGRVAVLDIGDPRRPFVVASHPLPSVGWDVAVIDDVLWVADGDVGIERLDLDGCGVRAPRAGGVRVGP